MLPIKFPEQAERRRDFIAQANLNLSRYHGLETQAPGVDPVLCSGPGPAPWAIGAGRMLRRTPRSCSRTSAGMRRSGVPTTSTSEISSRPNGTRAAVEVPQPAQPRPIISSPEPPSRSFSERGSRASARTSSPVPAAAWLGQAPSRYSTPLTPPAPSPAA
jgi:hypothetical protein